MENELMHYGVLGMKWGVRRYKNEDGSLTSLGKKKKEYDEAKKQYRSGYRQAIGDGAFAVWPDRRAFIKAVNANTKKQLKETKGLQNKLKIRQDAKRYKQTADIQNMLIRSAGREYANRIKDSMNAEIKGISVSQVRKGRQKTERILNTVGATLFIAGLIGGYGFLEYKLNG